MQMTVKSVPLMDDVTLTHNAAVLKTKSVISDPGTFSTHTFSFQSTETLLNEPK